MKAAFKAAAENAGRPRKAPSWAQQAKQRVLQRLAAIRVQVLVTLDVATAAAISTKESIVAAATSFLGHARARASAAPQGALEGVLQLREHLREHATRLGDVARTHAAKIREVGPRAYTRDALSAGRDTVVRAGHRLSTATRCTLQSGQFQATAAGAFGGAAALGASGAATGLAGGLAAGTAVGSLGAMFTFGLSIPVGAAIGGGTGWLVGAAVGAGVGAVGGGMAGSTLYKKKRGQ